MATGSTDLDRLIEEGLTLYGQGDLDGALLIWEQVLGSEPDNAQANSYVDYVRMNYELLTSDLGDEDGGPFGIAPDGEPEYQIEILPGEAPTGPPPLQMDPLDEGWFIGDEGSEGSAPDSPSQGSGSMTLELEADEPPAPEPEPPSDSEGATRGMSFEDATLEYSNASGREPAAHSEFSPEATPGFGNQQTDVRRRDLGFVKPTGAARPSLDIELPERTTQGASAFPESEGTTKGAFVYAPPELKITLRTPQHGDDVETADLGPPGRGVQSSFERSYAALDIELPSSGTPALSRAEEDELISSLPSPRAHITRDLPLDIVPPHQRAALDAIELDVPIDPPPSIHGAPTRELGVAFSATQTQEFGDKPTQQDDRPTLKQLDPMVSAPTRELGLRATSGTIGGPGGGRTPTEDQPTLTGSKSIPVFEADFEGTRGDIVLSFDPIDARTAQILTEVDRTAPANEPRDEKTRRRITTLCDQAQIWAATNELDKAVAAIDLALSEDPNSALAQKLIHRNREAIMSVFQGFLGDLDRQPSLARPLHELGSAPISPRAAFLLSRVDGSLTLDEILDVSGMPRLEAYRYLCQLFLRGILR